MIFQHQKKLLQFALFFVLAGSLVFTSCKKEPGEGGNSKIIGKVYVRDYDPYFTFLEAEYWASDEDVYIIYGDGVTSNNRVKAGPNGDFEFLYLRKGNYQIYVYSDDSTMTSQSGKVTVFRNVEITKNKQAVDVGTMIILKN